MNRTLLNQSLFCIIALWAQCATASETAIACLEALYREALPLEVYFQQSERNAISFVSVPVSAASLYGAHRTGYLPERGDIWEVPQPRGIIELPGRKISTGPRREIAQLLEQNPGITVTLNSDPTRIVLECARMPRKSESWMTPEVIAGYQTLANLGLVFSVEVWDAKQNLIAGNFGVVSNGHVQGVSKFRDLKHPLAEMGVGHLASEAEYYYFWKQGITVFDVEVAKIKGGSLKRGVGELSDLDFVALLSQQNALSISTFPGAVRGLPLPKVNSDFIARFRQMHADRQYNFN
jgi:Leu/Phe-tRNA-protein transferase